MGEHLKLHGDGVRVVSFSVDDCEGIYKQVCFVGLPGDAHCFCSPLWSQAVERGGVSVSPPTLLKDEHGTATVATIKTYGDTTHTFVQVGTSRLAIRESALTDSSAAA